MKRSEMLSYMIQFIDNVEDDYDKQMSEEDIERLLLFIERLGMEPPAYKDPDLDGHRFGEATYKNEWEPEND